MWGWVQKGGQRVVPLQAMESGAMGVLKEGAGNPM